MAMMSVSAPMTVTVTVTFGVRVMTVAMATMSVEVSGVVASRTFNRSTVLVGFQIAAFEELADYQYAAGAYSLL